MGLAGVEDLGVAVGRVPPEPFEADSDWVLFVEPAELEVVDLLVAVVVAEGEVLDVLAGSGVKGLRARPARWWEAPLVVSAAVRSGLAGAWLTAIAPVTGDAGALKLGGGVAGVEPPPPNTA
jgi:hypothetical protein